MSKNFFLLPLNQNAGSDLFERNLPGQKELRAGHKAGHGPQAVGVGVHLRNIIDSKSCIKPQLKEESRLSPRAQ